MGCWLQIHRVVYFDEALLEVAFLPAEKPNGKAFIPDEPTMDATQQPASIFERGLCTLPGHSVCAKLAPHHKRSRVADGLRPLKPFLRDRRQLRHRHLATLLLPDLLHVEPAMECVPGAILPCPDVNAPG